VTKETNFEHPSEGYVALLYYDVDNDRFQLVTGGDVDADIPADAKAKLVSALSYGWDGSAWQKLPMVWGFTDRWFELVFTLDATLGSNDLVTAVVPPGYVYRAEWQSVINGTRNPSRIWFAIWAGATGVIYEDQPGPGANTRAYYRLPVTLKAGDKIGVTIGDCGAGDDIFYRVWGTKMKIAE